MCPQKLNVDSSENDLIIRRVLENLDYKFFTGITFTGGEPLLKSDLIELALEKSPKNVFITILSNGSVLPSQKILGSGRVKMCVPLYSSFDEIHNLMTGSSSFYKVVKNLMRISSFDVPLELRFVMTRLNSKNLLEFSRFAARNLPFCLFDKKYHKFLVKSISPWKVRFLEKCESCGMKGECGGMFFSDVKEFERII